MNQTQEEMREEFDKICDVVLLSGGRKIEVWNFLLSKLQSREEWLIEKINSAPLLAKDVLFLSGDGEMAELIDRRDLLSLINQKKEI